MLKLASSVGFALALANLRRRVRRLVTQGILGAVAAVIFVIGLCFLLVAVHLWLSELLSPVASAAIIGGVLLAVALILLLLAAYFPDRRRGLDSTASPLDAVGDGMARLNEALTGGQSVLTNRVLQLAGVALVGFILGRRSRREKD
jgi:hypothetical protein